MKLAIATYFSLFKSFSFLDGFLIIILAATNKNLQAFGERVARNAPIQGTAADIIKIAMVNVAKRLREECADAKLVLQVHDELIVETTVEESKKAAAILKEEMENAANLAVPLEVDASIAFDWFSAHAG